MPERSAQAPSWDELTTEQRCIMFEGGTGHTLVDVLPAWVAAVKPGDAPYWNRKGENWDPGEDLARCAGLEATTTEPMAIVYALVTGRHAAHLGLVRFPGDDPGVHCRLTVEPA